MSQSGSGSFSFHIEPILESCSTLLDISQDEESAPPYKSGKQGNSKVKVDNKHNKSGVGEIKIEKMDYIQTQQKDLFIQTDHSLLDLEIHKNKKEMESFMTPGKAAGAAWVLFRFKRMERTLLRRFLIHWVSLVLQNNNNNYSNTNKLFPNVDSKQLELYIEENTFSSMIPSPTEPDGVWNSLIDGEMKKIQFEEIIFKFILKRWFEKFKKIQKSIKNSTKKSPKKELAIQQETKVRQSLAKAEQQIDDVASLIERLQNVGNINVSSESLEEETSLNMETAMNELETQSTYPKQKKKDEKSNGKYSRHMKTLQVSLPSSSSSSSSVAHPAQPPAPPNHSNTLSKSTRRVSFAVDVGEELPVCPPTIALSQSRDAKVNKSDSVDTSCKHHPDRYHQDRHHQDSHKNINRKEETRSKERRRTNDFEEAEAEEEDYQRKERKKKKKKKKTR